MHASWLVNHYINFMPPHTADIAQLQSQLFADLLRFAPETALIGTIVVLLLSRLVKPLERVHLGGVALAGSLTALGLLLGPCLGAWTTPGTGPAFTGLLQLDDFSIFLRGLLLGFAALLILLTLLTGIPDHDDSADFHTLLLGGTLGLCIMVSANHLLMIFLGIEMASLPCYALSGFMKGRRLGSEAALKYVIYGAASAGVMLYGISLLTATFGTGDLPKIAEGYALILRGGTFPPMLAVGTVFVLIGFGFKLAAVPFHFWLPDVFEGAAAEVGAFLSVASKAAAVGLTARFLLTLQTAMSDADPTILPRTVGLALVIVSAVTATFGNLAAFGQTNLKRLFGYSTIAHAGYMLMGLATLTLGGVSAVLFYLVAYVLMNLGAFAVIAVIRNQTGEETIDACRGLWRRSPAVTVALAIFLASLLGLPPLAGFVGKFQVFAEVFVAGRHYQEAGQSGLGLAFTILLGVAVVNTVLSAGYYLRILKSAGLDDPSPLDEKGEAFPLGEGAGVRVYLTSLVVGLLGFGIFWGPLVEMIARAVRFS